MPLSLTPAPVVSIAPDLSERTDDDLMLLARGGRREAFETLVRRHQALALGLASRLLGDGTLARDAAQESFLAVHRGLEGYRPQGRFVFFLRRLILNHCRMLGRSQRARSRSLERLASHPEVESPALPDHAILARERQREVDRALQELSEKLREVVALRYVGGHSLEEVAEILQLPLGTVKSRLFAAVEKLRSQLGEAP